MRKGANKVTKREKLLEELGCAITATLGSLEDEEFKNDITKSDIDTIAHKVKFYLDLE